MKYLSAGLLGLILAVGCVPPKTTVTPLSSKTNPPRPQDCDIQILTQPPSNRKYEEIAILNTVTGDGGRDLNAMLPSIKVVACGLGADAVLIKNVEPGDSAQRAVGKAYTVAIKFLD
jgi:hypothetical protein